MQEGELQLGFLSAAPAWHPAESLWWRALIPALKVFDDILFILNNMIKVELEGKKDAPVTSGFPGLEFQLQELELLRAECAPDIPKEGKLLGSSIPQALCRNPHSPRLSGNENPQWIWRNNPELSPALNIAHLSTCIILLVSEGTPCHQSLLSFQDFLSRSANKYFCDGDGLIKGSWELLDIFINSIHNRFLQINP